MQVRIKKNIDLQTRPIKTNEYDILNSYFSIFLKVNQTTTTDKKKSTQTITQNIIKNQPHKIIQYKQISIANYTNKYIKFKKLQPLRSQKIDSNKQQRSSISYKQQSNLTFYKQQKQQKHRKQTQTTSNQSLIFNQSQFFQTMSKNWIKPSDYIKDITQLNLIQQKQTSQLDPNNYQIKLNEKLQKNVQKIQKLFKLTQKWIGILKRALFYANSQKANSDKLIEQVKFWKALSKSSMNYNINSMYLQIITQDDKTKKLLTLMKNSLKTNSQHRKMYEQFQKLRDQVIKKSVQIKRLYLTLQQVMAGLIIRFQQSSCIKQSLQLLKRIIFGYNSISSLSNNNNQMSNNNNQVSNNNNKANPYQSNLLQNRQQIFYNKILLCLIQKILASPIYPKQLTNISSIKPRYQLLDSIISFCSNFISILQQQQLQSSQQQQNQNKFAQIIKKCQYVGTVVSNLIEILWYFQYLYKKKDVKQFSKLFSEDICYNIYDPENQEEWNQYMDIVHYSMEQRKYQP